MYTRAGKVKLYAPVAVCVIGVPIVATSAVSGRPVAVSLLAPRTIPVGNGVKSKLRTETAPCRTLTFETAPALVKRVAAGEPADILIAPPKVMDELVATGKASASGSFALGRAGVGVCVRAGQPFPDVSSTEALKRAVLAADAVFHTQASSGTYVAKLLERLGLAAQLGGRIRSNHDPQHMIKCFITLALLIGLFAGAALGEDTVSVDLNTYQWKNRLLLLFASSEEDQAYLTLKKEIDRQAMEVRDRELLVFYVLEKGESRLDQERLSPDQALFLRKRLSVQSGRFTVILIGKDGGEKIRQGSSVDLKEIFAIIDAMPMRQQEMKKEPK